MVNRLDALKVSHLLAAAAGGVRRLHDLAGPVIERAAATDLTGSGSLADIEHVVLLMNENRSFDHYFGTMSGVAGFDGDSAAFAQQGYTPQVGPDPTGILNPFHLDAAHGSTLHGDVVNDPDHSWGVQHESWDGGTLDRFVRAHLRSDGARNGPVTMGYYEPADIPVHRALADAFTICDHYFCSVLGPTDPNRLYWMTGTLDPDGFGGGPLLDTPPIPKRAAYSWKTYPECLQDHDVSWKIYQDRSMQFISEMILGGMMDWFSAYNPNTTAGRDLIARGISPSFPEDLRDDVANNTLPSVSWIIPSVFTCEHPALPPALGALGMLEVLDILTSNPAVWEKTALIVSYDENGGFFDHVPPPTARAGTPGEFVTLDLSRVHASAGIPGPIGLGFRVPCLVISPYSRGGLVASDVFDHTSQLRLLETRFGVPIPDRTDHQPGLSAWRRQTVGDLTSAFDFGAPPDDSPPPLPPPDPNIVWHTVKDSIDILLATIGKGRPYPVPPNKMPSQANEPPRRHPTG
jgi:phospholipase C